MTFEELDQRFPNGFDDAELRGLTIDYQRRTAELHLNMRGNLPDGPNANEYRRAILTVKGFYYLSIEAPDADHIYPLTSRITVDGLQEDPDHFPPFEVLKSDLPDGAFCCRFFVHDWNSFIHVAAKEAEFLWT